MNKALYNKFIVLLTSRLLQTNTVFMFCTPEFVLGGTEEVGTHLHVLRSRTHFGRYRGRRAQFSYFVLADSFGAVPRASGPVFMFFTPGLIFGGTDGIGSRFHFLLPNSFSTIPRVSGPVFYVLRSRARFGLKRGRWVPFSSFTLLVLFWTVQRARGPVFMFCAIRIVWCRTKGGGFRFPVLRSLPRFRRYRGRRVPFSCFVLPDSFWAAQRASRPV
jgi:hypothetical protein